ncbi:MAG: hypothetical protein HQ572_06175 [Candidatus Omnitrophica bacterium]|nr:hypothetical protein [Candidatus Omnitrophota bacterium]
MKSLIIIYLLMGLCISGCATTGGGSDIAESPRMLDVAMALKFEDVPMPAGFKPVAKDSFIFENDVLRVGILKYSGRAQAHQVVSFYKDQMPLYNWRFLNMMEYGKRIMNFDREDQTCIIVIEPGKMSTSVIITVAPKAGRASTYKSIKRDE